MKPQHVDLTTQHASETFWHNLALLKQFIEVNKHFPAKNENKHLYQWMNSVRAKYKAGRLPGLYISELNALGFNWSVKETKWYQLAQDTSEQLTQGKMLTMREHPLLYRWLRNSLDQYRNKLLTEDKRKIIEELLPKINQLQQLTSESSFLVDRMRELNWEEQFDQLVQFRKIHTKCWPRRASGNQAERELYKWCSLIRCIYRQAALGDAWAQKLKGIGFKFYSCLLFPLPFFE